MMDVLRIGIIGCGGLGARLGGKAESLSDAKITAVCDVNADAAKALGEQFNAKIFKRYTDMLDTDVDAVMIATPNDSHAAITIAAVAKGKHVFCEKPMALKVSDCRRMIAAAEKANVKLMIGQVLRLFAPYWKAREIVESGELGKPFAISVQRVSGIDGLTNAWRPSLKHAGGVLYEVHVHELDMMRFIMGEAESIFATTGHYTASPVEYEDTAFIHIRYANGGMGSLICGVSSSIPMQGTTIQCEKGTIAMGDLSGGLSYCKFGEEPKVFEPADIKKEDPYLHEVRSWIESITKGITPVFGASDGMRAIELAEAAYRSARTGRVVRFSI